MSETISKIKLNGTEYTLRDSTKIDVETVSQLIEITTENNTSLNTANDKLTQLLNKVNSSNGIDTSDATATAANILLGQTAYVNGVKVVGTLDLSNLLPENIVEGVIVGNINGIHVCDSEVLSTTPLTFIARKPNAKVLMRAYDQYTDPEVNEIDLNGIMYSLDNGETWQNYTFEVADDTYTDENGVIIQRREYTGKTIILASIGDKVCFKNTHNTLSKSVNDFVRFKLPGDGDIIAIGNVMSMLNFSDTIPDYGLYCLFHNCPGLFHAPKIYASSIGIRGCGEMFDACENLSQIMQEIPATTIGHRAYFAMFRNCPSLHNITLDISHVISIGEEACAYMFENDTNLENANVILPSNVINRYCYYRMFANCSSLISGADITMTNISVNNLSTFDNVCEEMYYECSSLKTLRVQFTSWPDATNGTRNWVYGVKTAGTFYCSSNLSELYGANYIPIGWTIVKN